MDAVYWSSGYYGDYSWELNRSMMIIMVMRNDRKYSLIRPFWVDTRIDIFIWIMEVVLGKIVSSQMRSKSSDADFWLMERVRCGDKRCITEG